MNIEAVLSGERQWHVAQGHVMDLLRGMPDGCVQTVCTSPPYWGLRTYSTEGQVWGGDTGCQHEWGVPGRGFHPGQVEQTKWKNATAAGAGGKASSGQFCAHCGAWYGELGLEPTPQLYVEHLVELFREVRRVLRKDGTLWLNLGDSYVAGPTGHQDVSNANGKAADMFAKGGRYRVDNLRKDAARARRFNLRPKNLVGIPWRVAFALQEDGWILRSEITWCKRAPMPESVRDRPTSATEKIFLFAKSNTTTFYAHPEQLGIRDRKPAPDYRWEDRLTGEWLKDEPSSWRTELLPGSGERRYRRINLWTACDYFMDMEAIKETSVAGHASGNGYKRDYQLSRGGRGQDEQWQPTARRNAWNYITHPWTEEDDAWLLSSEPFPEAHFAVFPSEIPRRAILAGTSERGCCSACNAPYKRVVERGELVGRTEADGDGYVLPKARAAAGTNVKGRSEGWEPNHYRIQVTTGWQPTCDCSTGVVHTCVVLDPFSGSGTTGVVALRHGRRYIGLELNPSYVAMSERRIVSDAPLFNHLELTA